MAPSSPCPLLSWGFLYPPCKSSDWPWAAQISRARVRRSVPGLDFYIDRFSPSFGPQHPQHLVSSPCTTLDSNISHLFPQNSFSVSVTYLSHTFKPQTSLTSTSHSVQHSAQLSESGNSHYTYTLNHTPNTSNNHINNNHHVENRRSHHKIHQVLEHISCCCQA